MPLRKLTAGILQVAGSLVANVLCCCCRIVNNSFGVDNLATDFTVVSGSWSISSGTLRTSSNGAVLLNVAKPTGGIGKLVCSLRADTDGLVARLFGAYTDSNNYVLGEATRTGATTSDLKLFQRVAGVTTQLGPTVALGSIASLRAVELCWDGSYACFKDGANNTNIIAFEECAVTGPDSGFGADAAGGLVDFDSALLLNNHVNFGNCASCTPCWAAETGSLSAFGGCLNGTQGTQVQLDLVGVVDDTCGDCEMLNTTYIVDLDHMCDYYDDATGITICSTAIKAGFTMSPSGSSPDTFAVFIGEDGGGFINDMAWTKSVAIPTDCTDDITLDWAGNGSTGCDGSGSTMTRSHLP